MWKNKVWPKRKVKLYFNTKKYFVLQNNLYSTMKIKQQNIAGLRWLQQEQKMIKDLYEVQQVRSWRTIANKMNEVFTDKKRTPKQYRQRYINFIKLQSYKFGRASWTSDQDRIIFQKFMMFGSKWVQISKFIEGRSQNQIKNRFYSTMRKLVRKIAIVLKNNKNQHNIKKMIKQCSIYKLLQTSLATLDTDGSEGVQLIERGKFINQLKLDCINIASQQQVGTNQSQIIDLAGRIQKFNSIMRFQNLRKSRKAYQIKRKSFPPLIHSKTKNCLGQNIELQDKVQKFDFLSISGEISQQIQQITKKVLTQDKHKDYQLFQMCSPVPEPIDFMRDLDYQLSLILGIQYQLPAAYSFH